MNYSQAIAYLDAFDRTTIKLGLERMELLMSILGNPQDKLRFVHVTGTNGKGSTVAMLKSILMNSGYKVGAFTSPHLVKINESIAINGDISDAEFVKLVEEFATIIADNTLAHEVTKFEVLTALAIYYFAQKSCDIVLLEVGLGGLTDSTNIVRNTDLAIFTKISLDHVAMLGNTVEEIARVKAGIIKPNCGVVVASQIYPQVIAEIEKIALANNSQVVLVENNIVNYSSNGIHQKFDYKNILGIEVGLLGSYQIDNALTAINAAQYLKSIGYKISELSIKQGLCLARWQCRLERISRYPLIYVDGGHNIDGINAVYEYFKEQKIDNLTTIFGVLKDKEYQAMLAKLMEISEEIVAVEPLNPRALNKEIIVDICLQNGISAKAMEIEKAVNYAIDKGNAILIIGSLYYVGEAKKFAMQRLGGQND